MTKPPIRSENMFRLENCAVFNFRKIARATTQLYENVMKEIDLRATQFTILGVLSHKESFTMNELAEAMVLERTTLTRNLKLLEKRGYINIRVGDDRRERHIHLTQEGSSILNEALPLWREAQTKMLEAWGQTYPETLQHIDHTISTLKSN